MVSIHTGALKKMAGQLEKEAADYNDRISRLEDCVFWLHGQEFGEKEELCRILKIQFEELLQQKNKLLLLSEAVKNVCDCYENTEKKIAAFKPFGQKAGQINRVNLKPIRDYFQGLGIQIEDL